MIPTEELAPTDCPEHGMDELEATVERNGFTKRVSESTAASDFIKNNPNFMDYLEEVAEKPNTLWNPSMDWMAPNSPK